MVKKQPANREIHVSTLGQEDPLEKKMTIHSSILAWEVLRTEVPGGHKKSGKT